MPVAFAKFILPAVFACISLATRAAERERHSYTVPKVFEYVTDRFLRQKSG